MQVGMASFWPQITVFAKQLGVSEVAVGLLFTVAPVTGLISMPLFGVIADRFKIKRKLFLLFNIISFISLMSFAFLPQAEPVRPVSIECNEGLSFIVQAGSTTNGQNEKCNQTDIGAFKIAGLIETCDLACSIMESERSQFCDNFLGSIKPSFCSKIDEGYKFDENHTFRVEMSARLKVDEAMAVQDVLYLPIDVVKDKGSGQAGGYSCAYKSTIQHCQINCNDDPSLNLRLQKLAPISDVYSSGVFWAYVFLVLIAWIGFAVVTSVADALCFQTLGKPNSCIKGFTS
jgi:hypothetical protein